MTPTIGTVVSAPNFAAFDPEARISFVRDYNVKVQAIPFYRHSIIRYRVITSKKDAGEVKPAKMVTVPQLELPAWFTGIKAAMPEFQQQYEILNATLLATLEDAQDSIIREAVDAGKASIAWTEVTLDMVLAYITAARVSQRLTREAIEAWMSVALKDILAERATELHDADKSVTRVPLSVRFDRVVTRYKQIIGGLAAAVPALKQEEAEAAQAILVRSKCDDDMARALLRKVHALLNPPVLDSGDL